MRRDEESETGGTAWGNRNRGVDKDSIQLAAISLTARSKSKAIRFVIDVRDESGGTQTTGEAEK